MKEKQIFVADAKFHHVIHELESRGWKHHKSPNFPFADLIWRNYRHIAWTHVRPRQMINHIEHSIELSKKSSFSCLLRFASDACDEYYPRCYFLRNEPAVLAFCTHFLHNNINHQAHMSGNAGMWIIKPATSSKGLGIQVVSSISQLISVAKALDFECVVQKYVERPLLIHGCKFDIRQWVAVVQTTKADAPSIWWYEECYCRLASESFSTENLDNPLIHLCNYSIQQETSRMWSLSEFCHHFQCAEAWQREIKPKMQRAVLDVLSVFHAQMETRTSTAAASFEWFGVDFMLDDTFHPWLIEVNVSPDLSDSTTVTAALVPQATRELFDRKSRFMCIHFTHHYHHL